MKIAENMVMGLKNSKNQEKSRGKQGFCLALLEGFEFPTF